MYVCEREVERLNMIVLVDLSEVMMEDVSAKYLNTGSVYEDNTTQCSVNY
jgi:hypothetical protein